MKKHGKTLNALDELPYNVRLLYVHAYQSYIFNVAASRRIESGTCAFQHYHWFDITPQPFLPHLVDHLNPIVGDLVFNKETEQYEAPFPLLLVVFFALTSHFNSVRDAGDCVEVHVG